MYVAWSEVPKFVALVRPKHKADQCSALVPVFNTFDIESRIVNTIHVVGFNHGLPCHMKNSPRDSVDKNQGRRLRFSSLLRHKSHVLHVAWEAMIRSCYSRFIVLKKYKFWCLEMAKLWLTSLLLGKLHCCDGLLAKKLKWMSVKTT